MNEPLIIVGDITTLAVDAIVNAANNALVRGGGVCGAIHEAAGPRLEMACATLGGCPTGEARITDGFELPARFVIHTAGPMYQGGAAGEADLLAACYQNCLQLAHEHGVRSVAFPCISTGIFGYPRDAAAFVATNELCDWLHAGAMPDHVICCCFDDLDADVYRTTLAQR